ncbi:MAG: restriction endonuclease [Candidatus Hodarchaeales archaeon]
MTMNILADNLQELTVTVFESVGFSTHHPALIFKHPLADSWLSLVVKIPNTTDFVGVAIKDFKRVVGIRQIRCGEELLLKCPEISRLIVVSSMGFSTAAKKLAEQLDISLITKNELISMLINRIEFS